MSKNVIYCYSGTGNSLEAAKTIAGQLGDTSIISMSKDPLKVPSPNAERIGFVFPVHHWNMPSRVREFVKSVAINSNAYLFAIAVCGGVAVNTLNDFDQLIAQKGAKLSYSKVHKTVASYIVAYGRFPDPVKQIPKSQKSLMYIIEDIQKKVCNKAPKGNPIKYLQRAAIFNAVKKFPQMDKDYHISEQCNACGTCIRICPAKNIKFENGKPAFQHRCEQCMACI